MEELLCESATPIERCSRIAAFLRRLPPAYAIPSNTSVCPSSSSVKPRALTVPSSTASANAFSRSARMAFDEAAAS